MATVKSPESSFLCHVLSPLESSAVLSRNVSLFLTHEAMDFGSSLHKATSSDWEQTLAPTVHSHPSKYLQDRGRARLHFASSHRRKFGKVGQLIL